MPERTPEQLAYAWRDTLLGHDAVAFAGVFAADGVMVDVEHRTADLAEPRPIRGREAIEAMSRSWLESTPSFGYEVLAVIADPTRAAVRWRYTLPPIEGAGLELEGLTWLSCSAGEIVEARVEFDSFRLLRHLGLLIEA